MAEALCRDGESEEEEEEEVGAELAKEGGGRLGRAVKSIMLSSSVAESGEGRWLDLCNTGSKQSVSSKQHVIILQPQALAFITTLTFMLHKLFRHFIAFHLPVLCKSAFPSVLKGNPEREKKMWKMC